MRAFSTFVLRRWPALLLSAALLPLTLSCKEEKEDPKPVVPVVPPPATATVNSVSLEFQHNGPGNPAPLRLNTRYATPTGQPYQVRELIYYVSNIRLLRADGSAWAEPHSYHLVNVAGANNPAITLDSVPVGTFTKLEFSLGVDSVANHHGDQMGALSPNAGMQWNWNTGYIFWKLEGDYLPVGDTARTLTYHIGRDPQYRTILLPLPKDATVTDSIAPAARVLVDLNRFFTGLDLTDPAQRMEMGGGAVASRIADNMATLFRVDQVRNDKQ